MIAVIQIMAQIGCFVTASNAKLRMTDKIFSRIGFQDSIEQGASSFAVELREMEYIYSNLTPNSLVIMDELCRSTNPQEGELICWNFCEKLLNFIGLSDENYFKPKIETEDDDMDDTSKEQSRRMSTLQIRGNNIKLNVISRPFIFLTTHFTSLTKLADKFNNAINIHMLVEQRTVEGKPRLEFRYKIQSGPTTVKNYGLALARCLRFPTSLIDRAEELVDKVTDETLINFSKKKNKDEQPAVDQSMETVQELAEMDKEIIDLYSYILLLMDSDRQQTSCISVDMINQKLKTLTEKMSPEFRDLIRTLPLAEIISLLNTSKGSESFA
jgi:DNA mismatch repair ATPase MutS